MASENKNVQSIQTPILILSSQDKIKKIIAK